MPTLSVVALHGCTWTPWRRHTQLEHVVAATRECCRGADILTPLVPIEFWSLQDADLLIEELIDLIDGVWQERVTRGRAYRRVILIGFSFGSVLVRQLFCRAAGARMDGRVDETHARPWIDAVERVVQIAGLNRGWTVDSPVTRIASLSNRIGTAIGLLLPWKPTLFAIRRGAPFLTRTRLQWQALKRSQHPPPLTVQLLGTHATTSSARLTTSISRLAESSCTWRSSVRVTSTSFR